MNRSSTPTCNRISATTPRYGAISPTRISCERSPTSSSSGTRRPAATTDRTSTASTTRDRIPETVSRHLFESAGRLGVDYAILNPLTRGNIADYLLNSRICAAVNDWLLDRWLEPDTTNRFRGTIRVNPEDPKGAVDEIERLAGHPKLVQVGVPMQSREPYGKPMFEPIWEAAAAHGLPVAVHINGGNGVDHAPTFAGHAHTYPGYAAFMPLNYFVHLATLIVEGMFGRHPGLKFVFADGGYDILTPLMWRLDTFWLSMRDQTPWVDRYPSEYLPHACPVLLVGVRRARSTIAQDAALDGLLRQIRPADVRVELPALVHIVAGCARPIGGSRCRATREDVVAETPVSSMG